MGSVKGTPVQTKTIQKNENDTSNYNIGRKAPTYLDDIHAPSFEAKHEWDCVGPCREACSQVGHEGSPA